MRVIPLAFAITLLILLWRNLPAEGKAAIKGFLLRHWWVPVSVFTALTVVAVALSAFSIKLY